MANHLIWLSLFLVEAVAYSSAVGSVDKNGVLLSSKIEIKGPTGLAGELSHHGALFGRNFFGETVEKKLYYTKRSLCNGQIPDTPDYIKQDGYFLLVDRGECSFVEKVRNAQRDGAAAVFIADDRCLCSDDGLCDQDVNESCERIEPIMDDDGSGSDIQIPSMLLLKSDADRLRDEIKSGSIIETSLSFPVPKATNGRTEYMLFTTPDDLVSHQFLDSFLEAALGFGTKAVFEPRMLITDGTQKGCRQYEESHVPCKGYCTNYGRYCESPSVYDTSHYEDKGTKVIVESMRRTCIWNIYGKADGVGKEWWAYVQLWTLQCSYSQYSSSCAESIYAIAGIDKEEVDMCIENSGSFQEDVLNTLMETSLSDIAKYQVKFSPTLVVNGAIVNGALTFGNTMNAICSTFEKSERPGICDKWDACSDVCSNDKTCVLWGDKQECSEYIAPYISNEAKQFDDDFLNSNSDEETEVSLESSDIYLVPSTEVATKSPIKEESNFMRDQTDSTSPMDSTSPAIDKIEISNPPIISEPQDVPRSSDTNTFEGSDFKNEEVMYSHDGQHEFVETIQIYEGSRSDLAIGLGVGFSCAFLLIFIWIMISRERKRERQIEDLLASGRMSRRIPRSGFFRSRRRRYDHYSSKEIDDQFTDEDEFSEEEDYYNERGDVMIHQNSRYCDSTRRERDLLFPRSSRRNSRTRQIRRQSPPEISSGLNEKEMRHSTGRISSIRKKINDDEFSSDYKSDSDRTPKMRGKIDDDENNNIIH